MQINSFANLTRKNHGATHRRAMHRRAAMIGRSALHVPENPLHPGEREHCRRQMHLRGKFRGRGHFRGRGFTAVEMLGASVLAAILMMALLAVTRSLAVVPPATVGSREAPAMATLKHLIQTDLRHMQWMRSDNDAQSLVMQTRGGLDPRTRDTLHHLCEVRYRIRQNYDEQPTRWWLVREQTDLLHPGTAGTWSDLVLPDITAIQLQVRQEEGLAKLTLTDVHGRQRNLDLALP